MNINNDVSSYKPPYQVILMDATDANYYADIYDGEINGEPRMSLFDKVDDLGVAKALADGLFVVKNYKWESLDEMNNVDGGYDVRVFDSNFSCVHAAHESYKDKWIGKNLNFQQRGLSQTE